MSHCAVITGMGLVSPIGLDVDHFWNTLITGGSGITYISSPAGERWPAAPVEEFDPQRWMTLQEARHLDRFAQFALAAACQAWQDAGAPRVDGRRAAAVIGTGFGGIASLVDQQQTLWSKGPRRVSPYFVPKMMGNSAAAIVSVRLGLMGPNNAILGDATSSAQALAQGLALLRRNEADIVVAGGSEAALIPLVLASLHQQGILTSSAELNQTWVPFDQMRRRIVLGEGAAILILETEKHALQRGAKIYAAFSGFGQGIDHADTRETGFQYAMERALADARIRPNAIDYINIDGSALSSPDGDEISAITHLFGKPRDALAMSSIKAATGHLWGASSGLDAIATVLAIRHQLVPSPLNGLSDDTGNAHDSNRARPLQIRQALSNSQGIMGQYISLVFSNHPKTAE